MHFAYDYCLLWRICVLWNCICRRRWATQMHTQLEFPLGSYSFCRWRRAMMRCHIACFWELNVWLFILKKVCFFLNIYSITGLINHCPLSSGSLLLFTLCHITYSMHPKAKEFELLLRHALWVVKDSNTFRFTDDVVVQYSVFLWLVIVRVLLFQRST